MNSLNSSGWSRLNSSIVVSFFFFLMLAYFSAFDLPGRPYHGKEPFKKYKSTLYILYSYDDYTVKKCFCWNSFGLSQMGERFFISRFKFLIFGVIQCSMLNLFIDSHHDIQYFKSEIKRAVRYFETWKLKFSGNGLEYGDK